MRIFSIIFLLLSVAGFAYWAAQVGYSTRATQERIDNLHLKISKEQHDITLLRAEWLYLNRPERLRALVDMNFETLRLVPLSGAHFFDLSDIPLHKDYPLFLSENPTTHSRDNERIKP